MEVSAPQMLCAVKLPGGLRGDALLRQKLLAGAALTCLYGQSSPLFSRLYAEGLVNTDFFAEQESDADTLTLLAGGETREPERVLAELCAAARDAAERGLDEAYFRRTKRAAYGARLRALSSFSGLCASLSDADFGGFRALDAFAVSETITAEELRDFIAEHLTPERFVMSVITPLSGAEKEAICDA
jgi:predicted Zn-dependent peptidase